MELSRNTTCGTGKSLLFYYSVNDEPGELWQSPTVSLYLHQEGRQDTGNRYSADIGLMDKASEGFVLRDVPTSPSVFLLLKGGDCMGTCLPFFFLMAQHSPGSLLHTSHDKKTMLFLYGIPFSGFKAPCSH